MNVQSSTLEQVFEGVPADDAVRKWQRLVAGKQGPPDTDTRDVLILIGMDMIAGRKTQHARIAALSGLTERSVRKHIAKAKKAGWLTED